MSYGYRADIDNMLRTSEEEEEGYNMVPPSVLRPLNALREQIASPEMNDQYKVMQELAGILAQMVTPEELPLLLKSILVGLTDSQLPSALGTCVVLNGLIKNRGEELKERVPEGARIPHLPHREGLELRHHEI
jgi:hypothetical protein